MKSSPLPRKTTRVSDSLHRQLNMYSLAASAAGVSLLALAAPIGLRATPASEIAPPM